MIRSLKHTFGSSTRIDDFKVDIGHGVIIVTASLVTFIALVSCFSAH